MAEIYGSHFEYGGVSSRVYGLIFATVETNRTTSVSGQINGQTIFDERTKRQYLINDDYSASPLTLEVEFVTDDDRTLNHFERRDIERWLFNRHDYRKLYLDIDDDCYGETVQIMRGLQKRLYLNCRFVGARKLEYQGGIVGYIATLEADSGYWWQDAVTYPFEVDNEDESAVTVVSVTTDTDIDDYIYPIVSITVGDTGGEIKLINNTDDSTRFTTLTGLSANDVITINGEISYLTDSYYEKFVDPNFPRLLDGENNITIQGNVSAISFTFQNRRYL